MKFCAVIGCIIMSFGLAAAASDSTAALISTIAGNGTRGSSGDGGPATAAQLDGIGDIALDTAGNLYVAEANAIRKVSPDGVISTVPGAPAGDIAVDAAGNIYVGRNDGIWKITPAGAVSSLAGDIIGNDGWEYLGALVNDSSGNVYFSYATLFVGTSIYKVNADETVAVVGDVQGERYLVAVDSAGSKYLYDGFGVQKLGGATPMFSGTGNGFAVDSRGNLFISEVGEKSRIWKVTPTGTTSIVAGNGTSGFSGDGGPATSAQLNSPASVAIDNEGNLIIGDSGNFRVRKVSWSTETYFAHVAVGSGYSTTVTLTNTGDSAISGSLILTDPQGQPLTVSVAGVGAGSSFPVSIAPAGTSFLSINPIGLTDPLKTGWATVAAAGGVLNGVVSFHHMSEGIRQAAAGVLPSQPTRFATIPVDDDFSQERLTAYAVANPTSQSVVIRLALVDQDGTVTDDTVTFTLQPKQQIARYLYQDLARQQIKGSMVLRAQQGGSFVAIALVQHQKLLTAIPVISGKAPSIPD